MIFYTEKGKNDWRRWAIAEKSTFIKIDRNITRWRWYKDANTLRVFLHLIIHANISDHDFEDITVHRGQIITSYPSLADSLNLTIRNVRTALDHLKTTGEVTVARYPKYSLITVVNYDLYQSAPTGKSAVKRQSSDSQTTVDRQQSKNIKKLENEKKGGDAPLEARPAEGTPEFEAYARWRYQ